MSTPRLRDRIAVVVGIVAIFLGVMAAKPCQADTPEGVSRPEYRDVESGWGKRHVERAFDVEGEQTFRDLYHWPHLLQKVYPLVQRRTGYVVVYYAKDKGDVAWGVIAKTWCEDGVCS